MYDWRNMTDAQRREVLDERRTNRVPWHSPPHRSVEGECWFLITASCYEHAHVVGKDPHRMAQAEDRVLAACRARSSELFAWCVLPNHYHVVVQTEQIRALRQELGRLHGGASFEWNKEDSQTGRKVWHNCTERVLTSDRHFWATVNYVHHNPVHHGYVEQWQDWPWSSARRFVEDVGREKALEIWKSYPILDYGKKWDVY